MSLFLLSTKICPPVDITQPRIKTDFNSILAIDTNQFGIPAKANGISRADAWLDTKKYGVLFDLIFFNPLTDHLIPEKNKIDLPQFLAQTPKISPLFFSKKDANMPERPKKTVHIIVFKMSQ